MTPPPTPFHLFRPHHAPIASLAFSQDNKRLIAGDQDGYLSVTDLVSRRVVYYWKAHENGILGVGEWDGHVISHGRDNLIHIYESLPSLRGMSLAGGSKPKETGPGIWKTLPVNSLNFCRFSLAPVPHGTHGKGKGKAQEALLAVPNLVDSELADVYHLPSMKRIHAALNYMDEKVEEGKTRSGLIMSLHLRFVPLPRGMPDGEEEQRWEVRVGMGFEDGRIELWSLPTTSNSNHTAKDGEGESSTPKEEKRSWERFSDGKAAVGPRLWQCRGRWKGHNEAVMAMAVDQNCQTAWTVSADHNLVKYDLTHPTAEVIKYSTKQIGNASIALPTDEKYLAVGGWDGKIRLFSAATGKPLGGLEYHRDTVHAIAFPHPPASDPLAISEVGHDTRDPDSTVDGEGRGEDPTLEIGASDSEDDGTEHGGGGVGMWMVSGGKDTRIALWELKNFG